MQSPGIMDVLAFVFMPKALSWYFLPLLILTFGYGALSAVIRCLYSLPRALAKAAASYVTSRANYRVEPKAYLSMALDDLRAARAVEMVPGLLVTIGILGTFVGLGVSLRIASGSLGDPETAIKSLDALLATVAFKFQTSAWGIMLSMLYQVTVLAWFHREVEVRTEAVEQQMLGDYRSTSEALQEVLEGVLVQLGRSTEGVRVVSSQLQGSVEEFKRSIGTSTAQLESSMKRLDGLGERLDAAIHNMGKTVGSTLKEAVEKQGQESAKLTTALNNEMSHIRQAVLQLGAVMQTLDKSLSGSVNQMGVAVGQRLDGAIARQQGQFDAMSQQLGERLGEVARQIGNLDAAVAGMSGRVEGALGGVGRAVKEMQEGQTQSTKRLDDGLKERLAQVSEVLGKVSKSIDVLGDSLQQELASLRGELGQNLSDTKKYTNDLAVTMAEMRTTIRHFEDHLGRLAEVLERAESKADADIDLGAFGVEVGADGSR